MSEQGVFITFEGGEGSGKTTQINKLAERLVQDKVKILTTREPGGTEEAEKIRNLIVQRNGGDWTPMAEVLLINAARTMHVEKIIAPALGEGKVVLCDRFVDSTMAYQGYGHGFEIDQIKAVQNLVIGDLMPDLTFVLDIEPEVGLARSGRRLAAEALQVEQNEDRFENMGIEFHERLRAGFLEIAAEEAERCAVFDAAEDVDVMADAIYARVSEALKG